VDQTFLRGQLLAGWLGIVGAGATLGQIQLHDLRHDLGAVFAPSQRWLGVHDPALGDVPVQYGFDTPVGAAPDKLCGRVLFSDFHVDDALTSGTTFPSECAPGPMTAQEKLLEYMIFDLGSCVTPPACVPTSCAERGVTCGFLGDGCGNLLSCGACPEGQVCREGTCGAGACGAKPCTPGTCADFGYDCGAASDGCDGAIHCGACPGTQICGGNAFGYGGLDNVCGGGAG